MPKGILLKSAVMESGKPPVTPQLTIDLAIVSDPRRSRKQSLRELTLVVAEIRDEAQKKRLDKMPKREIHAAVAAARRDLKNSNAS